MNHSSATLQRSRPYELVNEGTDPFRSGHLRYRYLDTGEEVVVPNVAGNQTDDMRIVSYEVQADRLEQLAEGLAQHRSRLMVSDEAQQLQAHYAAQAALFRREAAHLRAVDALHRRQAARSSGRLAREIGRLFGHSGMGMPVAA
jgi:hypothetical protein